MDNAYCREVNSDNKTQPTNSFKQLCENQEYLLELGEFERVGEGAQEVHLGLEQIAELCREDVDALTGLVELGQRFCTFFTQLLVESQRSGGEGGSDQKQERVPSARSHSVQVHSRFPYCSWSWSHDSARSR